MKIENGDCVTLKSGGPKMTVKGDVANQQNLLCQWFKGNELKEGVFSLDSLIRESSENEMLKRKLSALEHAYEDVKASQDRQWEERKREEQMIHMMLDECDASDTACGGEGDAEVRLNIFDRFRSLKKRMDRLNKELLGWKSARDRVGPTLDK